MQDRQYIDMAGLDPIRHHEGKAGDHQLTSTNNPPLPPELGILREAGHSCPDALANLSSRPWLLPLGVATDLRKMLESLAGITKLH